MSKDTTVSARVEYDVKDRAEAILQRLGIPVSVVINALYRQIIYTNSVPFSLSLPNELPSMDALSPAELDAMLQHSYDQAARGEGRPLSSVMADMKRGRARG
ncbi:MAG: type II toxin-antitoxin system RelB/DinJ family antitoxin [Clostridia bacterium]|nr:type II toxin-antitoxin system RelB/DinJ family antitoxin [Clostridia bacterium]